MCRSSGFLLFGFFFGGGEGVVCLLLGWFVFVLFVLIVLGFLVVLFGVVGVFLGGVVVIWLDGLNVSTLW